jgi:WD40 repeat protein
LDKNTGGLLRTLSGHAVAFDSTYLLASGSGDGSLKLWNKHNGDLLRTLVGRSGYLAFAANNVLASGSHNTITLWDTNTGSLLRTLEGHGSSINQVAFDSSNLLASGSYDGTIKLWRT